MASLERERWIAEDLRDRGVVVDMHFRVWLQHKHGFSFLAMRPMFRRSTSTMWQWYQSVQFEVEKETGSEEDAPRAGVTVQGRGIDGADSRFVVDGALNRLGF